MAQRIRRYVIDATEFSAVVRCTRCPWRGFSHSKTSAYRQIARHLTIVHEDHKAATDARRLGRCISPVGGDGALSSA